MRVGVDGNGMDQILGDGMKGESMERDGCNWDAFGEGVGPSAV